MKRYCFFALSLLLCFHLSVGAQEQGTPKKYQVYSVAFYNVENLFDTEDDPNNRGDDEYLPSGPYNWTPEKYQKKLTNIARVLSRLGREMCPQGPAVIGVSEVENRKVLEDLVQQPAVQGMNLQVLHFESPDWRGIDCALLYNPALFTPTNTHAYPYPSDDPKFRTRDQLLVSGKLVGEEMHFIVNHWPSRYGSKSTELREAAARGVKHIVDSLYQQNPKAKVVIMGDLNDDPVDASTALVLKARRLPREVKPQGLFNTMWRFYEQGIGSLAYQGKWNLFDQIIISEPLLNASAEQGLRYLKAEVFNRDFLIQKEGKNKGYPHRTFSDNTFINGYSDHFPTLIYLYRLAK